MPSMRHVVVLLLSFCSVGFSRTFAQEAVAEPPVESDALTKVLTIPASDEGLPGAGPIRRYDWMQGVWTKRRTTFEERRQEDQGAVVFLGDSITQGWSDDFRGDFDELGIKVANRGISGDTTRGMLVRLQRDVLDLKPTGVVLLMGTNDLEEGAEPKTIVGNVDLILQRIQESNPEIPVVLNLVMPSSETKKRPSKQIQAINEGLVDLVRGNRQVTIVDTWTLFANQKDDAKAVEFPDLLHPGPIGYSKWRAALLPIFDTLELTDVQPDSFSVEPSFASLFTGSDLTGWCYLPTSKKMRAGRERWLGRKPKGITWPLIEETIGFAGEDSSPDGRYVAKNGRLTVKAAPEGRVIQQLWTNVSFSQDFILRLEFRAAANADSGVFIREPQLQCRDYSLAGPYKDLKNYRPQDWNELEVVVKDDIARATCNGEVLEEAMKLPSTGPIGLEGDRGQVEYRRIRIKTLD